MLNGTNKNLSASVSMMIHCKVLRSVLFLKQTARHSPPLPPPPSARLSLVCCYRFCFRAYCAFLLFIPYHDGQALLGADPETKPLAGIIRRVQGREQEKLTVVRVNLSLKMHDHDHRHHQQQQKKGQQQRQQQQHSDRKPSTPKRCMYGVTTTTRANKSKKARESPTKRAGTDTNQLRYPLARVVLVFMDTWSSTPPPPIPPPAGEQG